MTDHGDDRQVCWEQIARANPLFRIAHVFADRKVADRLVPLHAFFASIERICSSFSDEDVAARKLSWWRDAMSAETGAGGGHPVLEELRRSGVAGQLDAGTVGDYFDAVAARIDSPSPASAEELDSACRRTGLPQVRMELTVCGQVPMDDALVNGLAARRGLTQLVFGIPGRGTRRSWWVPLDLLAKHGFARDELAAQGQSGELGPLVDDVLSRQGLDDKPILHNKTDISIKKQEHVHLFVLDALVQRRLTHANLTAILSGVDKSMNPGLGDLLAAWKTARRVNRRK